MIGGDIKTPADALLFCDYLAKFGMGDAACLYAGIASVIRELTRRLEEQAIAMERLEASREAK
jgi:hypothetical protein